MARYLCKGTKFLVDKTGSGTFTKLSQVMSVAGPGGNNDVVEDTDLDSLAKEYSCGLADSGEVALSLRWDPGDTDHSFVENLRATQATVKIRISMPTKPAATLFTADAFVTQFDAPGGGNSDPLNADVTFQVTGAWVKTTESV